MALQAVGGKPTAPRHVDTVTARDHGSGPAARRQKPQHMYIPALARRRKATPLADHAAGTGFTRNAKATYEGGGPISCVGHSVRTHVPPHCASLQGCSCCRHRQKLLINVY